MQELLQKSQLSKHSAINAILGNYCPLSVRDDENVLKEQLIQAENVLLEVDKVLQGRVFATSHSPFIEKSFEKDINGDTFITQSNIVLPFDQAIVSNAFWSVLGFEKIKKYCYEYHVVRRSEVVIAQSFSIRYADDCMNGDFRCRYTLCRFSEGYRVVIVWVGLFEPVVFDGLMCGGIRCQQIGWIELQKLQSGIANTTLARHQSRLKVDTDENVHKENILKSLFSLAPVVSEKLSTLCGSMLEKTLIEEDWKLNGDATA